MRRTLTVVFAALALFALAAPQPSRASDLTELLFGSHREYREPGITWAIDRTPKMQWLRDARLTGNIPLTVRYWKEGDVFYQGETLGIGGLIMSGDVNGRKHRMCISDASARVDRECRDKGKRNLGGFRVIGEGYGKYCHATLDTTGLAPGTYFLYLEAEQARRGDKFGESAVAIQIADPLPDVIAALSSADDKTLGRFGLEARTELVTQTPPPPPQQPVPPVQPPVTQPGGYDGTVGEGAIAPEPTTQIYTISGAVCISLGYLRDGAFCPKGTVKLQRFCSQMGLGYTLRFYCGSKVLAIAQVTGFDVQKHTITAVVVKEDGPVARATSVQVIRPAGGVR